MKKGVVSTLSALAGIALGAGTAGKALHKKIGETRQLSDKHLTLFLMMDQWVRVKQEGKNLASYFEKNGYKKIAVYGMSYAGIRLIDELKNTGVEIAYGIDRNAESLYADVDIVSMDDSLEKVDAIVVTAVTTFDEIREMLSKVTDCPVLSLEDILYEV